MAVSRAITFIIVTSVYFGIFGALLIGRGLNFNKLSALTLHSADVQGGLLTSSLRFKPDDIVPNRNGAFLRRFGYFANFGGTWCSISISYNSLWAVVIFSQAFVTLIFGFSLFYFHYGRRNRATAPLKLNGGKNSRDGALLPGALVYFVFLVFPIAFVVFYRSPNPIAVHDDENISAALLAAEQPLCFPETCSLALRRCVFVAFRNATSGAEGYPPLTDGTLNSGAFPWFSTAPDNFTFYFYFVMFLFLTATRPTFCSLSVAKCFLPFVLGGLLPIVIYARAAESNIDRYQFIYSAVLTILMSAATAVTERITRAARFVSDLALAAEMQRYSTLIDELVPVQLKNVRGGGGSLHSVFSNQNPVDDSARREVREALGDKYEGGPIGSANIFDMAGKFYAVHAHVAMVSVGEYA